MSELLNQAVQLHTAAAVYSELFLAQITSKPENGKEVWAGGFWVTQESVQVLPLSAPDPRHAWAMCSWLEWGCVSQTCTKWPKVCPGELWAELLHMEKWLTPCPTPCERNEQCRRCKQRGDLAAWWYCSQTEFIFHGICNLPSQNSLFITLNWKQM